MLRPTDSPDPLAAALGAGTHVSMLRTLRIAAVADARLADSPALWLVGLVPVLNSIRNLEETSHPAWMDGVLLKADIAPAFAGGPALVRARAALQDLAHVALDLRRAASRATPDGSPQLSPAEQTVLAESCRRGHREALRLFEVLEGPVTRIMLGAMARSEGDTRP